MWKWKESFREKSKSSTSQFDSIPSPTSSLIWIKYWVSLLRPITRLLSQLFSYLFQNNKTSSSPSSLWSHDTLRHFPFGFPFPEGCVRRTVRWDNNVHSALTFLLCFFIDVGWRTGAIVSNTCQNASASLMFTTNPITAAFLYYSNLNRMCNPFEGSRKTPTRRSIWSAMNLTALWLNDSELIEYYDTTWGKHSFLVSSPSSKRTQNYKHRHWIKSQV